MFRRSRTFWLLKALLTLSGAKRTREIRRQAIIIINLYDGPYRADTGWPGVHPQHAYIREAGYIHQVNGPSRSLIATAFSSAVCRKRLRLRERSKRLVDLIRNVTDEAKVVEEYNLGPSANSSAKIADDDPFAEVFALRRLSDLSANSSSNLAGMIGGIADEFAADLEIVEIFNRTPIYDHVAQMVLARPPLSAAALRFFTVAMGQGRAAIDRAVELGVPTWLLQCREASDVSNDFNNNVAATCQAQSCRDDALQILGFVANQQPFHASCDIFNPAEVRVSRTYLAHISRASRTYLGRISRVSRAHLARTSRDLVLSSHRIVPSRAIFAASRPISRASRRCSTTCSPFYVATRRTTRRPPGADVSSG